MVEKHLKKKDVENPWRIDVGEERLQEFLKPISEDELKRLLKEFSAKNPQKHSAVVSIARMQPLHFGHILGIRFALQAAEKVIIGIGSSNIINKDNPWTIEEREKRLTKELDANPDIKSHVLDIVRLPDFVNSKGEYDEESDKKWIKETLRRTDGIKLVVGANEWVNRIYVQAGGIALVPKQLDREIYQGSKIRAFFRAKKPQ